MVAASFDRFVVISRLLKYNTAKPILAAKLSIALIWFSGIAFAFLSIAVAGSGYAFVAFNLAILGAKPILILYSFFSFS